MKYRFDPFVERLQYGERYPLFTAFRDRGQSLTLEGAVMGWHWLLTISKP